jgi:signal transduction histidine kinase
MALAARDAYRERMTSVPAAKPAQPGAMLRTVLGGWGSSPNRRAVLHLVAGLLISALAFLVLLVLPISLWYSAAWGVVHLPSGLSDTSLYLGLTLLSPVPLLFAVHGLSALQRGRFRETMQIQFDPPPRYEGSWQQRLIREWGAAVTWRQLAYHLLALTCGAALYAHAVVCWSVGAAVGGWPIATAVVVAVLALPWLARGLAVIDVAMAQALLGLGRGEKLARRVESLTRSRAEVVAATDAERRRIERDLHDGAQQRLVSLAMNLGMARATLTDVPEPARRALAEAHDEAKLALAELRDLVRGLHPAVLNDRGLDAALSGLAARAPVPVRLRVGVAPRCSPTIEAVAYFIVSEALTNVAKHSRAGHADVVVEREGDLLRVTVTDDGRGGADLGADGGGLSGLVQRAESVDGILTIASPPGGPTVIVAELPCAS